MRLFIGIDIPSDLRERLVEFVARCRQSAPTIRFVDPEGYHITLKFLGETTSFERLRTELAKIRHPRFTIDLRGAGFFPNASRPRIFWAGIHALPKDALAQLALKIDEACAPVGFAKEDKPFRPHLTLARSGSGSPHQKSPARTTPMAQLARFASELEPHFGTITATEFHIYESRLHPKGAVYTKIATFALASPDAEGRESA